MGRPKANEAVEIAEPQSLEMEIGSNIRELKRNSADFRPPENVDDEMSATDLGVLLRRVSDASTRQIKGLIDELHGLRKKPETEGNRLQSDIVKYAELNQEVMQVTTIISDTVKKIPAAPNISP